MGLITLTGLLLFFAVNAAMQRAEQGLSQRKFNADERLVAKVLEYVQGIAEVKNFDLTHDSATQVHGAVEEARKASFAMEIPSVLYMLAQFVVNKLIRRCRLRRCHRLLLRRHNDTYKLPFDADLLVYPL